MQKRSRGWTVNKSNGIIKFLIELDPWTVQPWCEIFESYTMALSDSLSWNESWYTRVSTEHSNSLAVGLVNPMGWIAPFAVRPLDSWPRDTAGYRLSPVYASVPDDVRP